MLIAILVIFFGLGFILLGLAVGLITTGVGFLIGIVIVLATLVSIFICGPEHKGEIVLVFGIAIAIIIIIIKIHNKIPL